MLQLVKDDLWLSPYQHDLEQRLHRFHEQENEFIKAKGSLQNFATAHHYLGINYDTTLKGWWYREWAPAATGAALIGDFNDWNPQSHILNRNYDGIWEVFIPDPNKTYLPHGSKLKVQLITPYGTLDRIPAYIRRAIQNEDTKAFDGQHWAPNASFEWTDNDWTTASVKAPIIYECHLGMAQEKEGVGTYNEFTENILPRISKLGYNCVQMMAIQEHPYYGSFGYHVSNFFAPSSQFGTPEDLKNLINTAHNMGISIINDVVHSHSVKNVAEGLNEFDGSDDQYFHPGPRGYHTQWDSKCFNYGKWEVKQFLLSNLKYWMEEFHFDGFRFDGVTSMLYFNHGMTDFDHYDKYFKDGSEWDAITYLQLANKLIHEINPHALSIAEDMSGMPGVCRTIEDGGIGFDYRLGMGIPDNWIKLLKHQADEDWDLDEIWDFLTNRRYKEKTIAYAESHDQALVGDKTLAFWLMDKEMYWHMKVDDPNLIIDRGIALHKMIRLITMAQGGEGYLNFIGNEFGHPEWIDFLSLGNDWSYKYCRRQWHLVDNPDLKYKFLNDFDKEMIRVIKEKDILNTPPGQRINQDKTNQSIMFERGNLIFCFNFHPHNAIANYKFFVPRAGTYRILLNSDDTKFGGHGRIDSTVVYPSFKEDGVDKISIYNTNRTALILERM